MHRLNSLPYLTSRYGFLFHPIIIEKFNLVGNYTSNQNNSSDSNKVLTEAML